MLRSVDLHVAARLAQAAYDDRPDIQSLVTDTQVIVRDGNVVFRGTESLADWRTNLQADFAELRDGMMLHSGFVEAWRSVKPLVERDLGKHVVMIGHSLGGALAITAAYDLANRCDSITVVTFGAPRVAHEGCPLPRNVRHFRCVNNCDVVPRVPFRRWSYSHFGECLYWNALGEREDLSGWWKFLDRVRGRLRDVGTPGTAGYNDHKMSAYVELTRGMKVA